MTLIEVVAGLALLSSVLVAMLLARAGYMRQSARAGRRLQAVAAADALLSAWHQNAAQVPVESWGAIAGDGQLTWRTHIVASAEADALGARVVRLEVLDQRDAAAPVLARVDFVAEPDPHDPLAAAATRPAAAGTNGPARRGTPKGTRQTHAPGIHTP